MPGTGGVLSASPVMRVFRLGPGTSGREASYNREGSGLSHGSPVAIFPRDSQSWVPSQRNTSPRPLLIHIACILQLAPVLDEFVVVITFL